MAGMTVGLLHPGEMGAALGAALRAGGHGVLWASAGRSNATAARGRASQLEDVGSTGELARHSQVILSGCPPHAAVAGARAVGDFCGNFGDAKPIAPAPTPTPGARVSPP